MYVTFKETGSRMFFSLLVNKWGKIKFHIFSVFRGIEKSVSFWKKTEKVLFLKLKVKSLFSLQKICHWQETQRTKEKN